MRVWKISVEMDSFESYVTVMGAIDGDERIKIVNSGVVDVGVDEKQPQHRSAQGKKKIPLARSMVDLMSYLKENGTDKISIEDVEKWLTATGRSPTSRSWVTRDLVDRGYLSQVRDGRVVVAYNVLRHM